MPRKPRIQSSTGMYHIILRSVNQHIIFEDDSDYQKFLLILSDCKTKFNIDIFAYCLMDNHIHLQLSADTKTLSSFFQSIGSRFVRWYNSKYDRSGHLFQERYYSKAIETTSQYIATLIYIHNNPVNANICQHPSEYYWSSYNAFYGQKDSLVNISHSYDIAGSRESLLHIFSSKIDTNGDNYFTDDHRKTNHFYTDEQALEIFKSTTNLTSSATVSMLTKPIRNEYIQILEKIMQL